MIQAVAFKPTHDFKGKEGAFVLDIVREGRKVMVYILVENLKDYKEVYVQRSDETMLGTGNCKYFTPKDFELKEYTEVIFEDKYSLPLRETLTIVSNVKISMAWCEYILGFYCQVLNKLSI